ncbi:MAG: cation diffusion facilitator family transporter [Coriobacteriaceae bacterium]|nr:cation diffusion facilitator family transporter [Coriobacteriaceae bacterium]
MAQQELDAATREKVIVRTSVIGIAANVLLAAFKAAVGLAANSIAVVLDAVNNLTDALSSVITIIGAKLGGKAPDKEHPLGHGRYEYLSALVIAAIVLYAGITALVESVKKIIEPEAADYSAVALVIIAAAVIVKIILGRYVSAKGRQVNSGSLVASGKDALFDAVLSASVLAAALIYLTTGIGLEAYVGVAISIVIIKAGFEMLRETLDDILGKRPDPEVSRGIKRTVCADPEVLGAYDLLMESYGPNLTVASIHVEVADTMTALQIDELTRRLQQAVMSEHGIALATVGIYARNTSSDAVREMRSRITRAVAAHDGVIQIHGFFVNENARTCSFDVVLDFAVPDGDALYRTICDEVQALYPDYTFLITNDRDVSD